MSSSTRVTGTPAASIRPAVEPVETSADARLVQAAGQLLQPPLVVDGDQGALDRAALAHGMVTFRSETVKPSRTIRPTQSTSIWRSAVLMRSCRLSHSVVVGHRHRALGDDGPGVDPGVDDEQRGAGDLDAVGERVPRPVHPGERRGQRGVGVDGAAAEPGQERLAGQPHEAGEDHQARVVRRHVPGERLVPLRPAGVVRDRTDERGHAGAPRAGQALDAVAVGPHGRDPHAVRRVGRGVQQRLQVGAGTGDEDDDVAGCGAAPSRIWPVARRNAHGERG